MTLPPQITESDLFDLYSPEFAANQCPAYTVPRENYSCYCSEIIGKWVFDYSNDVSVRGTTGFLSVLMGLPDGDNRGPARYGAEFGELLVSGSQTDSESVTYTQCHRTVLWLQHQGPALLIRAAAGPGVAGQNGHRVAWDQKWEALSLASTQV